MDENFDKIAKQYYVQKMIKSIDSYYIFGISLNTIFDCEL